MIPKSTLVSSPNSNGRIIGDMYIIREAPGSVELIAKFEKKVDHSKKKPIHSMSGYLVSH